MSARGRRQRVFSLLLAASVFLLDQASKWAVTETLSLGESRRVLPGVFNLTYVRNRGAAFGLFADVESQAVLLLLIGFAVVALVLVSGLLWRGTTTALTGWGLALILGGALGNLLDRLRHGNVVDFLDFHVGSYHWPAFNVADSAIVVGAAVLMIEVLRGHRHSSTES